MFCRKILSHATLLLIGATATVVPAAAQSIDTRFGAWDSWDGFGDDYPNGTHRRAFGTGQTFVAPGTASTLDAFRFWTSAFPGDVDTSEGLRFQAFVLGWDAANGRPTEILWASAARDGTSNSTGVQNTMNGNYGIGWVEQAFFPEITLEAGGVYLALLSTISASEGGDGWNYSRWITGSTYTAGSAVQSTSGLLDMVGGDAATLLDFETDPQVPDNTSTTYEVSTAWDAAFTADFSAAEDPGTTVPEPVSLLLIGSGLSGIAAARRRRRA